MNGIPTPGGFRRILVALDASRESDAALAAAAELAQQLDAELMGLFIEDIDLLNLAALPFSREVAVLSLSGRGLDPERVARELRSKAAAIPPRSPWRRAWPRATVGTSSSLCSAIRSRRSLSGKSPFASNCVHSA